MKRLKEDPNMIQACMAFNGKATKEWIKEFLQEYVDGNFIDLKDIIQKDVLDTKTGRIDTETGPIWVAQFLTSRANLKWFKREFGKYLTVKEGW